MLENPVPKLLSIHSFMKINLTVNLEWSFEELDMKYIKEVIITQRANSNKTTFSGKKYELFKEPNLKTLKKLIIFCSQSSHR